MGKMGPGLVNRQALRVNQQALRGDEVEEESAAKQLCWPVEGDRGDSLASQECTHPRSGAIVRQGRNLND